MTGKKANPNIERLFDLAEGTRFYFVSDRGRKIWEVERIEHKEAGIGDWRYAHAEHSVFIKNDANERKEKRRDADVIVVNSKSHL